MPKSPARRTCSSLTGNENLAEGSNLSDQVMIVLRLIHIVAGVFWAGTVMAVAWFILPTAQSLGQPGGAFMQQLMFRQRLRLFVTSAMILTILSGVTMYVWLAIGTDGTWAKSRMGMTLGIGAVAAIIAGGIGGGVIGRVGKKMMALGTAIQASGNPPTESQQAELAGYQRKMRSGFRIIAILVLVATIAMASARYL
jgi:uncharacterized membrane protein